jgi:mannose-6-phosphate isomerase-like protein (cupin superfamily)
MMNNAMARRQSVIVQVVGRRRLPLTADAVRYQTADTGLGWLVMPDLRPMDATLDGYAWLPRMIDKARAAQAGTLGDTVHPCPVDRRCLALLGIDVETLGAVVARSADDAAVLDGLRAAGIASAQDAWFDAPAWEDALQEMVWRSDGETISDRDARNVLILHAEEAVTVTWSRYVSGEHGPGLHLHREHTDAFYILTGVMRFAFGPEGERVVRAPAGTLVSAPPGVAHTFTNADDEDVTWLNVHTPDAGFAAFLRGSRDGQAVPFDSFDVPQETGGDGGGPAADAIVIAPGGADGASLSHEGPGLRVTADRFRVDVVVPGAAAPISYCRI